jgi:hypothetical protein
MAEHGQLADYPPQGLTGATFPLGPGHDEDREGGTVKHASMCHSSIPSIERLGGANWRSH